MQTEKRPASNQDARLEKTNYQGVIYYQIKTPTGFWDERDADENPDYAGHEAVYRQIDGEQVKVYEKTFRSKLLPRQ